MLIGEKRISIEEAGTVCEPPLQKGLFIYIYIKKENIIVLFISDSLYAKYCLYK